MTDLYSLQRRAMSLRRKLDGEHGEMVATLKRGKALEGELAQIAEDLTDYERVNLLLTSIGEEKQLSAQQAIEELVTRGLQTIFDETLSFHIIQSVKGKNASVEFIIRTTIGHQVIDTGVLEARGGGVVSVVSFLLRVVVLLLQSGTRGEQTLVLDESFSMLSAEYLQPMGEFLQQLVARTGIQLILVTHQAELADFSDRTFRFDNVNGKTIVKEQI